MRCTSSDRRQALVLACLAAAACTLTPAPSHPCPALPPSAPPASAAAVGVPELRDAATGADGRTIGRLELGGENVRFQVLRASGPAPRPLVLLVPILAGGEDLMEAVGSRMRDFGYDVAFCARVAAALKPPQRGPELDDLFRRTVLHQRILLAWLRSGSTPPSATFVLGMSMGGMVATAVTAIDPAIDGVALCLAGGDLAGMVGRTSEGRVRSWVDWRRTTDGVGRDHVEWELRQFLTHEPLAFAASIPTEKVLFVGAAFDTVVPRRHQDLLWEALGRPTRLEVPFGHYSAALAIDTILGACASHFAARTVRRTAAPVR